MLRTLMLLGFVTSFVIALAMMTNAPETSGVEAQASEKAPPGCVVHEIALDEGYGVTRKSIKLNCVKEPDAEK